MKKYDFTVIGAGIVGAAIADKLSTYDVSVLIIEKEDDVGCGASRANSAIIHAGYDCNPATLKSKLNIAGAKAFPTLCEELDVPCDMTGSMVVAASDGLEQLKVLKSWGDTGGVPGLEILGRDRIFGMEPNLRRDGIDYALYAPTACIISPYKTVIALSERAVKNGADLSLDTEITALNFADGVYEIKTDRGVFLSKYIINCAGYGIDAIGAMAGAELLHQTYKRGEYYILDRTAKKVVNSVVFPLPNEKGKGVLVAPTVDGNIIVGPTASPITDGEDTAVTEEGLKYILDHAFQLTDKLEIDKCIRIYAGVRTTCGNDFVIRFSDVADNFVIVGGICSPGLSSAPAIADYVIGLIGERMTLTRKANVVTRLTSAPSLKKLGDEELNELIKSKPEYGRIVCRCETVSEGEIIAALDSPLHVHTVDGVKRRTRATMGRCQAGFCLDEIIRIISEHTGIPPSEVKKGGKNSFIICGDID